LATTTQETSESGILDIIKLLLAAGVLVGGLYSYYYFLEVSLPLRVLMVLGGTALHSGRANRDPQGSLADQTGNDADCYRGFHFHFYYGAVFLGSGFISALVDAHPGWLGQLGHKEFRGYY
jgi:hypothetical protein